MIRHESIEHYLTRLASGDPTPGGGATGALAVAEGAGLTAMAARYGDGEDIARACESVITHCLAISDADEAGFAAVADAFGLPKDSEEQQDARSATIQDALAEAVRPPRAVVDAVAALLPLAERVLEEGNPNVRSDIGTALGCARAGLTAAAVTLLTNLSPLKDEELGGELRAEIARADALTERTDALLGRVREALGG